MVYSENDVNEVYDRSGGCCFYCGLRLSFRNYGDVGARGAWEVDHFIPRAAGGADQPRNWVAACIDCNTQKSDLLPWEIGPYRFRRNDRNPDHYI